MALWILTIGLYASSSFIGYDSTSFRNLPAPEHIVSAATDGERTFYVNSEGTILVAETPSATPAVYSAERGVLCVEYVGTFVFLKTDRVTILTEQNGIFTNITPSLNLPPDTYYLNFSSGPL